MHISDIIFNRHISAEYGPEILRPIYIRIHICIWNVRIATESQCIMRYAQYWHGVHDCAAPQWSPVSCGEFGSLWHLTAIRLTWMCLLDALSPTSKQYVVKLSMNIVISKRHLLQAIDLFAPFQQKTSAVIGWSWFVNSAFFLFELPFLVKNSSDKPIDY